MLSPVEPVAGPRRGPCQTPHGLAALLRGGGGGAGAARRGPRGAPPPGVRPSGKMGVLEGVEKYLRPFNFKVENIQLQLH